MKIFVNNSFKCELRNYNSMCKFEGKKSDILGSEMNIIVNSALEDYYNTYKKIHMYHLLKLQWMIQNLL